MRLSELQAPAAPAPAGKMKLSDLKGSEAPAAPEKPSLLAEAGEAFADVPREIGHQFMQEGRAAGKDLKKAVDPTHWGMHGPLPAVLGAMGHGLAQAATPITGALTSALGRPVEAATGGKVPREVTGNIAALATPFAQEAMAARDVSALAKTLGLTRLQAGKVMERAEAAKRASKAADKTTMRENVKAMDRIGVKPSTVVASPAKDVRQTGQMLGQNLFVGEPVRRAVRRAGKGVQDATERAAEDLGTPKSVVDIGKTVKEGVQRFAEGSTAQQRGARASMGPETTEAMESQARLLKSNEVGFGRKADILYGRVNRLVGGGQTYVEMPNTQAALNDIRYRIGDPAFIDFNANPKLMELNKALEDQAGKMSFDGARRLRSIIRTTLRGDPALKATLDNAEIERLYQAMSRDLSAGAEKLGGADARKAFEQTDRYYRAGRERIERALDQVFSADTPNKVFYDLLADAQEGKKGDTQRLMQLRRSLKPEEWRDVAASVLDSMGRALPGQRSMETSNSFRTFLTNFNKLAGDEALQREGSMADSGLKVLFEGAGHGETFQNIRDIARVASELRELDKLYNHSLSGSLASNTATVFGLLGSGQAATMTHSAVPAITAVLGLIGGNAASLVLENPSIARYLAGLAKDGESLTYAEALPDLEKKVAKDANLFPLLAALRQPNTEPRKAEQEPLTASP